MSSIKQVCLFRGVFHLRCAMHSVAVIQVLDDLKTVCLFVRDLFVYDSAVAWYLPGIPMDDCL